MERFSICQLSSMRWSFYQDVVSSAAAGFSSLGVWRHKLDDCEFLEAVDFLHEMQVGVSSLHWAGGFTGGNVMSFSEAIEDTEQAIRQASLLDADCLIIHPGCRNGHTYSHACRLLRKALDELVPVATDYGIRLALELIPCRSAAADWTFLERGCHVLELIDDYPEDKLGLVLDLFHIGLNTEVFENLGNFIRRTALVQIADRKLISSAAGQRLLAGTGEVPLRKWLNKISELGYQGRYEFELHGQAIAQLGYKQRLNRSYDFAQSMIRLLHWAPQPIRRSDGPSS